MPLINIQGGNPLLDGRQSENALAIRSGMVRYLSELGMTVLAEFPLANGRRADLLALARTGKFTLVEIKSSIEDFRVDHKWHEYRTFCDYYCFATSANVPADIFPADEGLFIADSYGAGRVDTDEIARDEIVGAFQSNAVTSVTANHVSSTSSTPANRIVR